MAVSMCGCFAYAFLLGSFMVCKSSAEPATSAAQLLKYVPGWYANSDFPSGPTAFPYFGKLLNASEKACFLEGSTIRFASGINGILTQSFLFSTPPHLCGQQDFEFKIGSKKEVRGIQFVYTIEAVDDIPVLRASFLRLDKTANFTIDMSFGENEFSAAFTSDDDTDTTAKFLYKRILPPYVTGSFESDPKSFSGQWIELFQNAFSPAKDIKWTPNIRYCVERYHAFLRPFDSWAHKFSPEPSYDKYISFDLNSKGNTTWDKSPVQYEFRLVQTTLVSTMLKGDFKRKTGNYTITFLYGDTTPRGANISIKSTSGFGSAFFNSVLPYSYDGTFEESKGGDSIEWDKFMEDGGWPLADSTTGFTVRRDVKKKNQYVLTRKLIEGKAVETTFNLDAFTTAKLNGDNFQYKFGSPDNSNLVIQGQGTTANSGKSIKVFEKLTSLAFSTPDSLRVDYARTDVLANQSFVPFVTGVKFYRRVLPEEVFGKFESVAAKDDLKEFAKFYNASEVLKKTIVEFYPDEDESHYYHYTQRIQYGSDAAKSYKFALGANYDDQIFGKSTDRTCDFLLLDGTSVLRWRYRRNGDAYGYDIVQVHNKNGYTATYTYDRDGGEKIARQEFKRIGPARKAAAA